MLLLRVIMALSCLIAFSAASPVPSPMRDRSSSSKFSLLDWFKGKFACCTRPDNSLSGELTDVFNRPERPIGNAISFQSPKRNTKFGKDGHPLSMEDLDASSEVHIMNLDVHAISTADLHQTPQFRVPTELHFTFGNDQDNSPLASLTSINPHSDRKALAAKAKANSELHRGMDEHGRPRVELGVIRETARESFSDTRTVYHSFPPSNIVDSNTKIEGNSASISGLDRKHH